MNASPTRPPGIGIRTEIRLDEHHLVTLAVRAGELLRSAGGLVWATIDGELRDILLRPGQTHTVERDCTVRASAFGPARLEVFGHGPLRLELPSRPALPALPWAARAGAWG